MSLLFHAGKCDSANANPAYFRGKLSKLDDTEANDCWNELWSSIKASRDKIVKRGADLLSQDSQDIICDDKKAKKEKGACNSSVDDFHAFFLFEKDGR